MVCLQPFRRNSLLKCVLQPKIAKNSLKAFFGVQDCSKSSMLINVKSQMPVFVMISSMYVSISSHFHATRANSSKKNHSEDLMIIAYTILIQIMSVTDRCMPRPWLRSTKHFAVTLKSEMRGIKL